MSDDVVGGSGCLTLDVCLMGMNGWFIADCLDWGRHSAQIHPKAVKFLLYGRERFVKTGIGDRDFDSTISRSANWCGANTSMLPFEQ